MSGKQTSMKDSNQKYSINKIRWKWFVQEHESKDCKKVINVFTSR